MKKLITLLLVLTGMVSTASATEYIVKLKGAWDGWVEHQMQLVEVSGTFYYSFNLNITADNNAEFEFGIDDNGHFYKNSGVMTWDNSTNWTFSTGANNCTLSTAGTGAGNYLFMWNPDNKTLTVVYPNLETVYFYNNHNWPSVYVYLLGTSYWDDSKGSGSSNRRHGAAMAKMGDTDIWKLDCPVSYRSQYIAFVKDQQDNYGNFYNTEAVYREDFNINTPLYLPNTTDPIEKNKNGDIWTAYWNTGTWHSYSAPSDPYTRSGLTVGYFGTICLPYKATISGAKAYKISGKVMENNALKGINLEKVEELEAGEPYIFKATESTLTATLSGTFSDAVAANGMVGNIGSSITVTPDAGYYVIGGDNLIHEVVTESGNSNVTVGQYKAYITLAGVNGASSREANFIAFEDGGATGISQIENGELNNESYFDLQGRRVAQPTKGLYIVNGKKVIIK